MRTPLNLQLGNIKLQKSNTVVHLSLVFDSQLDLKAPRKPLKNECDLVSNLMWSVTSIGWEAEEKNFYDVLQITSGIQNRL